MDNDKYLKGTTTVGVVCTDGIVLASEQRATMGHFIASKTAKKVYQIDDLVGMTTAGSVGDAQQLVRLVSVESQLYKMRRNESMTIKGITTLMSNFLNANRYYPMMVQLLIGGVDKNGPGIYSLDPMGGSIEETRISATGSGSPMAYGILEDQYRENMTVKEGLDLAIRAIHNATKRDSASGENIDVVVITKEAFKRLDPEEVKSRRASLN
ncbi:proteasome subunit beta [Methanosarcina sp. 2.H.T.1A.6]|uniref:archaeal proteasome endopeptidase complex subunit beta n=1 Tax=unclassified Methanosarcina TaxID=2644672 RepID=UPI0006215501|nr:MULTISPECIES: archaeal proteasome endopeptidase complex subunit beta [unclassified Methanosarcina]KKG12174.1 proteasome subunit beta [Methanosarcina sp. 2.H.A.1B.4]KKG14358.1 proteasome subunit beta [Methanosarcina sp. 2.H.T.1A.3]KKG15968.1 proteasome subunit beta [Methanosarcina sp. 2.H.T.1A.15]KKG19848.1 proteasome subunit beta [Methanosarcina sp. 2.H.T.1A.6]KKG27231.1 proteasome subunit beta [Methanosarcina sp. 2.H.T.1A.8]